MKQVIKNRKTGATELTEVPCPGRRPITLFNRFRHWTPRYVSNRLALMAYERQHPDMPWLTSSMVNILKGWLKPSDRGLEWGSGRSTVWFARRVAHLVSVESDPRWANRVQSLLSKAQLTGRVDYQLHVDARDAEADSGYVAVARAIPPDSLDFCLVDGLARDHCALRALHLLRPGGILIVDNIEWYVPREPKSLAPNSRSLMDGHASPAWATFSQKVCEWRYVWTTNGVWDTAFWMKPNRV